MKIPLQESNLLGGKRFILTVSIPLGRIRLITDAILDTGAEETIIMEIDLQKTGIAYTSLPKVAEREIAKSTLKLIDLGEKSITLMDSEGKPVTFRNKLHGGVFQGKSMDARSIPTILGLDFFESNNFGISPRDRNGIRYLYTES